jgi:hypothetical protein
MWFPTSGNSVLRRQILCNFFIGAANTCSACALWRLHGCPNFYFRSNDEGFSIVFLLAVSCCYWLTLPPLLIAVLRWLMETEDSLAAGSSWIEDAIPSTAAIVANVIHHDVEFRHGSISMFPTGTAIFLAIHLGLAIRRRRRKSFISKAPMPCQ